jgi:hypothetical protein
MEARRPVLAGGKRVKTARLDGKRHGAA